MDLSKLLEIIEQDKDGIFAVSNDSKPQAVTEDERLVESFLEIVQFVRENGRKPENNPANMQEWRLFSRLDGFCQSPEKVAQLQAHDELGILPNLEKPVIRYDELDEVALDQIVSEKSQAYKAPSSMEEILNDDFFDGMDDEADIFTLKHVKPAAEMEMPDKMATRKPCKDFAEFEPLFTKCQADLKSGERKLLDFANEQQIFVGQFFVLRGILCYVAEVGEKEKKRGKVNARLRCIFENGTESNMLLRSLATELYKNGRRVSANEMELMNPLKGLDENDEKTGTIYVLKSLSNKPEIKGLKDLYKVGFTRLSLKERIKNAPKDPTFLMAPVQPICEFECYNMNPQKLENLLHRLFGAVQLQIEIADDFGESYIPREWFVVSLAVIEEAINLIISGEILDYRYDEELGFLVRR